MKRPTVIRVLKSMWTIVLLLLRVAAIPLVIYVLVLLLLTDPSDEPNLPE
jgi:hypothetical protein